MTRLLAKPQAALLLALCSLGLCGQARALDPELDKPYEVQVVLRVAPNRLLTPIFKEQLRRDLQQGLQAALGAMGKVKVIDLGEVPADKQEPLWQKVAAEGLQAGLDKPGQVASDVKTHFINVDYVDGQYEIQARQYDGLTGTATPTVRHERTPDRQFVARTAALLVDRDFGLVGTVAEGGDGQSVKVAFKGGGLKVPLDRWVKKGDVLALVQVRDGQTRSMPWMLLQADDKPGADGACPCKLFPPQKRPLSATGAGFRCIKLGTVKAPVRLRVVEFDPKGGPVRVPDVPPVVYIGRQGFTDLNDPNKTGHVPDADGFCSTEGEPPYDGVAFVTIVHGEQVLHRVPLALVDDRTVTLPIRLGAETPYLVWQRGWWERELLEEQVKLDGLFKSLNEDIGKAGRAATLERARKALDDLDKQITRFGELRKELTDNKPPKGDKPLDLSTGDTRLQDIKKGRGDLAKWVADLDKSLKEQKPGEGQEVLAAMDQARGYEQQAEYGQAIDQYEKVLAKTKDAKLEERLRKLKEAWKPQGDEHAKARDFIYQTWPKLDPQKPGPQELTKDRVAEAQKALAVCRKVKDSFGPRKVLIEARRHLQQITQELEELKNSLDTVERDRKRAAELTEVGDPLDKLIKDAKEAVEETPVP
jgi:tetratricopeptide (TPR) repeat protein